MQWSKVKSSAKGLIEYDGTEARINALEDKVLNVVANAHTWEMFMTTDQITYTGGADSIDLKTSYGDIHRLVGIRKNGSNEEPPEYIPPGEWNRLKALGTFSTTTTSYWTKIGTSLYILSPPSADTVYDLIISQTPENLNWGDLPDEFLDYASTVLARMLTPLQEKVGDRVYANPAYVTLRALEREALRDLKNLEYRRPGRSYKVRPDKMRVIRSEQYDY